MVGIAVDRLGNVYVTGDSEGVEYDLDYTTVLYRPDGKRISVSRYNGPARDNDQAYAMAMDRKGNVYITGGSVGILTHYDYATLKLGAVTPPGELFIRGDVDDTRGVEVADALTILVYLFLGGTQPCLDALDVDDNGTIDISDPIAILTYLFLGGPEPSEPFADCDADPTPDDLNCGSYLPCS